MSAGIGAGVRAASGRTAPVGPAPRASWLQRGVALAALLFALAYPAASFLAAPACPIWLKLAWLAALAAGAVRPSWGAFLLLAAPFLPIWPYLSERIPHGIVHVLVLSQGIPLLARIAVGRAAIVCDGPWWGVALLLVVALASAATTFGAYAGTVSSARELAGTLHELATRYVFQQPGPGIGNVLVAATTLGDAALSYAVLRASLRRSDAIRFVRALAGVAAAAGAIGIAQWRSGWALQQMWRYADPAIVRVNGTFADPNAFAAFLAVTVPILFALLLASRSGRSRAAWAAGCAVVAVALVLTAGRVGYAAAVLGSAALVADALAIGLDRTHPWRPVRAWMRRVAVVVAALVLVAGVALVAAGTAADVRHKDQTSYMGTLLFTANMRTPLNERLKGRIDIWRTVGLIVRDHPVFGAGLGTIYMEFPRYNRIVRAFDASQRLSAHNTFLNAAAETGAVGVAALLVLLALAARSAVRGLREDDGSAWERLGIAAGLLAFVTTGLSGDRLTLREDAVTFGILIALATLLAPAPAAPTRRLRAAAAGLAIVLAVSVPFRVHAWRERIPLDAVTWGFHPAETSNGVEFHWTTDDAIFHVPVGATSLNLPLRSLAPFPQEVDLYFNGRLADHLRLVDHNWRAGRYLLPRSGLTRRFHRVELRVRPVWQPRDDPRTLGVMVGAYSWQ